MTIYFEKKVFIAKRESVYGTDVTPAGSDAVLAHDLTIVPFENTGVSRKPATPWFRAAERLPAGVHVSTEFFVEAAGSGTKDTAPGYSALLRACGLAETITADTDVAYDPVSAGFDSLSAYFYLDGTRQKLLGWRGNVKFEAKANEVPKFRFSGRALYGGPSATAFPTPDFSTYQSPLIVNKVNTPTFSLLGFSPVLDTIEIDLGQQVAHRDKVGSESVLITGRAPTGRVVIEAPALGSKDYFAAAKANTIGTLSLIHGTADGAKVQVSGPAVKVHNPRYSNDNGVTMLEMDLDLLPDTGDDEIQFKTL